MTTEPRRQDATQHKPVWYLGFLAFMLLDIVARRYWPGSVAATVIKFVYLGWVPVWLSLRMRAGYLRRKPHWTRESWLRYLRLTAMPVLTLALVLYLSSFDMSSSNFFGGPKSSTRAIFALSMLVLMLLGAVGLVVATDWLTKGEPSEQFTRTAWFQRRRVQG